MNAPLWLLPALPLMAGVLLTALRRAERLAPPAAILVALLTLLLAIDAAVTRPPAVEAALFTGIRAGLAIDGLSAVMVVTVTAILLAVLVFAAGDIRESRGRFFGLMLVFAGAMLLTVTATDLLLLLMGWELMGAMSYALIGFWWREPWRVRAANVAFVTTRAGARRHRRRSERPQAAPRRLHLRPDRVHGAGGGRRRDGRRSGPPGRARGRQEPALPLRRRLADLPRHQEPGRTPRRGPPPSPGRRHVHGRRARPRRPAAVLALGHQGRGALRRTRARPVRRGPRRRPPLRHVRHQGDRRRLATGHRPNRVRKGHLPPGSAPPSTGPGRRHLRHRGLPGGLHHLDPHPRHHRRTTHRDRPRPLRRDGRHHRRGHHRGTAPLPWPPPRRQPPAQGPAELARPPTSGRVPPLAPDADLRQRPGLVRRPRGRRRRQRPRPRRPGLRAVRPHPLRIRR